MTFEQNGRTLSGNDPVTFVNTVQGLGADMLGVNCSLGPVSYTHLLGMKPGREIGEMLAGLLELVLEDPAKNKREVLELSLIHI